MWLEILSTTIPSKPWGISTGSPSTSKDTEDGRWEQTRARRSAQREGGLGHQNALVTQAQHRPRSYFATVAESVLVYVKWATILHKPSCASWLGWTAMWAS